VGEGGGTDIAPTEFIPTDGMRYFYKKLKYVLTRPRY
jgi:hypothetical protein